MTVENKTILTMSAGFGAAAATLYAAPELNADVVNLSFSPSTVFFTSSSSRADVDFGSTGGANIGSIGQYNDSVGKSMTLGENFSSFGIVNQNDVLNFATASFGSTSIAFSASASGTVYVGFRVSDGGGVGWFSLDLGGAQGDIVYNIAGGQWGNGGESVTVAESTPPSAVPGLGGLAALAMGASGVRSRRKRNAAS